MNWQTGIALTLLVSLTGFVIVRMILNKKKGKTSCSCGCSGCAFSENCHSKKEK